jgi:SAM-dependent methyltransferase
MRSGEGEELGPLLGEQAAYYRAIAAEYYDHALDLPVGEELTEALEAFRPVGSVLELACGPGAWTSQLLRHAADITAVDASPEMLAIAAARADGQQVRFIQADLLAWEPDLRYDVVFFGFWLSHVPPPRFESFWSLVADCLKPQGRVFFVDDAYRTPDELVEGPSSPVIRRQLNDGTSYRLVKVPHQPANLQKAAQANRLAHHGHSHRRAVLLGSGNPKLTPRGAAPRPEARGSPTTQGLTASAPRSPQPAHGKRHS